MGIWEDIGARRVINASFPLTALGGSRLSKDMFDAMIEINESFVDMDEFIDKAGMYVSKLLGVEATHITTGAFAALAFSAAACMAGKD